MPTYYAPAYYTLSTYHVLTVQGGLSLRLTLTLTMCLPCPCKVAFLFAFRNFYQRCLLLPAAAGLLLSLSQRCFTRGRALVQPNPDLPLPLTSTLTPTPTLPLTVPLPRSRPRAAPVRPGHLTVGQCRAACVAEAALPARRAMGRRRCPRDGGGACGLQGREGGEPRHGRGHALLPALEAGTQAVRHTVSSSCILPT